MKNLSRCNHGGIFPAILIYLSIGLASAQQINISRIEQMPAQPQPYQMLDWKTVALGYDSLVFDQGLSGEYLPLVWIINSPTNYPGHISFGLHTAVGVPSPGAEAINVLPAVISASLVGVDKSDQDGYNWVLMCEEFFNRRPSENVYLNNHVTSSGNDWWYDTMPNIFFYQLYDLYPGTGDFEFQFTMVADRWLQAVEAMGGSDTPWDQPYMNYRAFRLSDMTPLSTGVTEPEAAGAIAWLLYNAYLVRGDERYRIGAEWAMEFLNGRTANPSYELQLPYGVYTAARMNAELGTDYNMTKLVSWCFDTEGNIRDWGATLGNWGGYDCAGLIGEARYDGYAFIMNGFEQAGALVPMVRYDDRFARAIGRWMLNVANASRLFYSKYLPDEYQDGETWSQQYDPSSYIAHEAMREFALFSGTSPYATGDFVRSGWGATNFALYGSSHVGIFGGIIDTTNIPMILRLDVLKTDYFRQDSYATFLYYNPDSIGHTVELDVGSSDIDLYDAAANSFVATGVSGVTSFTLGSDEAKLIVLAPAGGQVDHVLDMMFIDDVIVDYNSGQQPGNYPPRIKSLAAGSYTILRNEQTQLYCTAVDPDLDSLTYTWQAAAGTFTGNGQQVTWTAPAAGGDFDISCIVDDGAGATDTMSISIQVLDNIAPQIVQIIALPSEVALQGEAVLTCVADDADEDTLSYSWQAAAGSLSGSGSSVTWQAPQTPGYYYISCSVNDGNGGVSSDSTGVTAGELVCFMPFSGNTGDSSGFANHGSLSGGAWTMDRFGNSGSALYLDGVDDNVRVPVHPTLNNRAAITVSFWMTIAQFFEREQYVISHGNWMNRWKVSIGDQRLRWTIKTDATANNGIIDLDSQSQLQAGTLYHVAVVYDGIQVMIYLNGIPNTSAPWLGQLLQTNIDLMIGQTVPGETSYNFNGIIDDVRIYNTALSSQEIAALYNPGTSASQDDRIMLPLKDELHHAYPNPFNNSTQIKFSIAKPSRIILSVYNTLGELMQVLVNEFYPAGSYKVNFDASQLASGMYIIRLQTSGTSDTGKILLIK